MEFWYTVNGKTIKRRIPKNNKKVPKTKRLRKKKFWMFCIDCHTWFKRYDGHGTTNDGGKVCRPCVIKRIKKVKPDLF
jgi:hypothetical protein